MKHATLLAFLGLGSLAACSTPPPLVTNCPDVAVLAQGSSLTAFLPGRQDVASEIAEARITGVAGSCAEVKDKKLLRVAFRAGFAATKGPAATGQPLTLPYLVSVSRGNDLLSEAHGSVTLKFKGNDLSASAVTKPIKFDFPNTPDTAGLDVLVSFHLTPEQLAYNRTHETN